MGRFFGRYERVLVEGPVDLVVVFKKLNGMVQSSGIFDIIAMDISVIMM
jgi:hypothetical protein